MISRLPNRGGGCNVIAGLALGCVGGRWGCFLMLPVLLAARLVALGAGDPSWVCATSLKFRERAFGPRSRGCRDDGCFIL